MIKIRSFNQVEKEYSAIAAVEKAIWGEIADTKTDFQHADAQRNEKYLFQRLVIEENGRLVAFASYAEPSWSYQPGKYQISINVLPDFERRGIGTAVYYQILSTLQARDPAPNLITSFTYSHKPQSIRFLEKREFRVVMRWIVSELDVRTFTKIPYAALEEKLQREGIVIRPLTQQKKVDPSWARAIYDLDWTVSQDEPQPYAFTRISFADYQKQVLEDPGILPDAWFLAFDGERYVGMTQLLRNEHNPELLHTGFTGIIRGYRRRGLATMLKVCAIAHAFKKGCSRIRARNEEHNPIVALNRKLGFEDATTTLAFEKIMNKGQ